VIGKTFQIRRLYRQSNANITSIDQHNSKITPFKQADYRKTESRKTESRKTEIRKSNIRQENNIYNRFIANYSQHNIPLPEVSFTEGLPLPDVSFSSDDQDLYFSNKKTQSTHKTILNNYIEDFFFETKPEVFYETEIVEFKKYKIDSTAEDEFITVVDEHDEFVRAFESLEKNVCFVR